MSQKILIRKTNRIFKMVMKTKLKKFIFRVNFHKPTITIN